MFDNSVAARALSAGLFVMVASWLAVGCDDGRGHYYGYGSGYDGRPREGTIRFEWSLRGAGDAGTPVTDAVSDDDAGTLDASSGGPIATDAGASGSGAVDAVDKAACDAIGAAQFQALLLDQGTIVAALQAHCAAGSGSLRVPSNDYTATAALANADGVPVSETELVAQFVVAPGETQVIRVVLSLP